MHHLELVVEYPIYEIIAINIFFEHNIFFLLKMKMKKDYEINVRMITHFLERDILVYSSDKEFHTFKSNVAEIW